MTKSVGACSLVRDSTHETKPWTTSSPTSGSTVRKAVFLDRDGTIIFDASYLSDPAQVKLLPDARQAITLLRDSGFMLFLFTNQSGIGRGLFSLDAVHRCNQRMLDLLGFGSELFTDICIAPERPDEPTVYRKPSPRFILESLSRHRIDRTCAWMIGDKAIDAQAGLNAGINAALIGDSADPAVKNVARYDSLLAFARAISTPRT